MFCESQWETRFCGDSEASSAQTADGQRTLQHGEHRVGWAVTQVGGAYLSMALLDYLAMGSREARRMIC